MTRPASLRPQRAFIGKNKKVGSKKLEIDFEKIDDSYNHRLNNDLNFETLSHLRQELIYAETNGRDSKAKKIRRQINQLLEEGLALQATWCGTCKQVLHRCRCKSLDQATLGRREAAKKKAIQDEVTRRLRARMGMQPLTHKEERQLRRESKENS